MSGLEVVRCFARALDEDDYDTARAMIAEQCRYEISGDVLIGPDAICASYEKNSNWARRAFDRLEFESAVEAASTGPEQTYVITYLDRLTQRGEVHEHRCQQIVTLDERARVCAIKHVELSGEKEAVAAFMRRVGVTRDP